MRTNDNRQKHRWLYYYPMARKKYTDHVNKIARSARAEDEYKIILNFFNGILRTWDISTIRCGQSGARFGVYVAMCAVALYKPVTTPWYRTSLIITVIQSEHLATDSPYPYFQCSATLFTIDTGILHCRSNIIYTSILNYFYLKLVVSSYFRFRYCGMAL